MDDDANRSRFMIVEYLTPPGKYDLPFMELLICSPLVQQLPLLIIVHPYHQSSMQLPPDKSLSEMLALLYVCGGRVRAQDWAELIDGWEERRAGTPLFAARQVATDTWISYAHRGIAEMARDQYRLMNKREREVVIERVLRVLPNNTGYPLLAIAAESGKIDLMQSRYSLAVFNATLAEPQSIVRYFDRLHRLAQEANISALAGIAMIGSLLAPIYIEKMYVKQVYQKLQGISLAHIERQVEASLWVFLGQELAVRRAPEEWEYAVLCLDRGRAIVEQLYDSRKVKRSEWSFFLVSAAKIEALIAYKLRQPERVCQLMEFAIAELGQIVSNGSYFINASLIDARVNFGDALLRLSYDMQQAILQYSEALGIVLRLPDEFKSQIRFKELRAELKLGHALVQVGQYEEAIHIFVSLLNCLADDVPELNKDIQGHWSLKARQALAEIYLNAERPRSAAACYWLILRHPDWLGLEDLQDTAARLRTLRPHLHERLHHRIDTIIGVREKLVTDMMALQNVLSDLWERVSREASLKGA